MKDMWIISLVHPNLITWIGGKKQTAQGKVQNATHLFAFIIKITMLYHVIERCEDR